MSDKQQIYIDLFHQLRDAARRFHAETGQRIKITGDLGELAAAVELGFSFATGSNNAGYDLISDIGERYSVKADASGGTNWLISWHDPAKNNWNHVVVVKFSRNYALEGIWLANREVANSLTAHETPKGKRDYYSKEFCAAAKFIAPKVLA